MFSFFFSSRRRHTRCALVTGVQTCALPIWLRMQPLAHVDRDLGWMMIHAGLAPKWTTQMAEQHAREGESRLRNGSYRKLFKSMYGDRTAWSRGLNGLDRERALINILPRMRYCPTSGRIAIERGEGHKSEIQATKSR